MNYDSCEVLDLGCHFGNLMTSFKGFYLWIVQSMFEGVLTAIGSIPVPDFMQNVTFAMPSGVLWFASVLQVNTGLALVLSALTLRFVLRRIPIIG